MGCIKGVALENSPCGVCYRTIEINPDLLHIDR